MAETGSLVKSVSSRAPLRAGHSRCKPMCHRYQFDNKIYPGVVQPPEHPISRFETQFVRVILHFYTTPMAPMPLCARFCTVCSDLYTTSCCIIRAVRWHKYCMASGEPLQLPCPAPGNTWHGACIYSCTVSYTVVYKNVHFIHVCEETILLPPFSRSVSC